MTAELEVDDRDRSTRLRQVRQAEKLIALGRLAAGVVHEIGAPLNVILGQVERLESSEESPRVRTIAANTRAQVERIARLLRRLARFARDRAPERVEMDLRELVEESVDLATLAALDSRVRLSVHNTGRPCPARVNPGQLHQVLTNLLLNAIEASEPHSTVRAGCERVGDEAVLWVEDDGCGIAPEHIASLFEPFVGSKDADAHVGLGLAIVREIVEAHGGTVEVESTPVVGACFRVRLPGA